jgi:hypothetical protein
LNAPYAFFRSPSPSFKEKELTINRGKCPQDLLCCQGIIQIDEVSELPSLNEMVTQLPDGFLNQFAPGSQNLFLGSEGGNIALLSGDDQLFQPFTADRTGSTGFDITSGLDLDTFQIGSNPPAFENQFLSDDQIEFVGENKNPEPVAFDPGFRGFLSG